MLQANLRVDGPSSTTSKFPQCGQKRYILQTSALTYAHAFKFARLVTCMIMASLFCRSRLPLLMGRRCSSWGRYNGSYSKDWRSQSNFSYRQRPSANAPIVITSLSLGSFFTITSRGIIITYIQHEY